MSSSTPSGNTLPIKVTNISTQGLWILADDKEFFLSYEDFPWIKEQPVKSIMSVEEPSPGHFYWPDIDVDLTLESIEYPEWFPLKSKTGQ